MENIPVGCDIHSRVAVANMVPTLDLQRRYSRPQLLQGLVVYFVYYRRLLESVG